MSYPPRPPMMPMPGSMPPMMPPYGYPPMMPPMGMMNQMMSRPLVPPPMQPGYGMMPMNMNNQANKPPGEKLPVTKVFVGNISERAPDSMIRQMLQRCGNVISWKRADDTSGKLKAFGFCEYDNPESTLRCIRLLNGYQIGEKKLLVKVDQKTHELLSEYIKKIKRVSNSPMTKNARKAAALRNIPNKKAGHSEDGELDDDESSGLNNNINLELVDEDTLKEDRAIILALELILKQYVKDLEPLPTTPTAPTTPIPSLLDTQLDLKSIDASTIIGSPSTPTIGGIYMKPHLRLQEIKIDEDKKEIITTELSIFREKHKDDELKLKQEDRDRSSRPIVDKDREKESITTTSSTSTGSSSSRGDKEKKTTSSGETTATTSSSGSRDKERKSRDLVTATSASSPERSSSHRHRHHSRSVEKDQQVNLSKSKHHRSTSRTKSRSPDHRTSRNSNRRTSNERAPGGGGGGGGGGGYRDSESRNDSPIRYRNGDSSVNKENNNNNSSSSSSNVIKQSTSSMTLEELEEERERKKLERKLREKEMAYRARLKLWEEREEKKRRQYLAEKKNEMAKRKLVMKEAKKLKQYMEDYDDEKDDSNYYKGSNLEKKLKFREKEIEMDNRDRQREKEELEELKKKLAEKGLSDVEQEAKRIQEDEHQRMKTKFEKLEESSSSSDDDSDNQSDMEQTPAPTTAVTTATSAANSLEQTNLKLNDDKLNDESKDNKRETNNNNKNKSDDTNDATNESTDLSNNKNLIRDDLKPSNLMSEESTSPYYNESPSIGYPGETPSKIRKNESLSSMNNDPYGLSSPNSNSPLYTTNYSSSSSLTHHVTIKTFTKKSIQPVNQAFADEDDEPSNGPQSKRAKLASLAHDLDNRKSNDNFGSSTTSLMSSEERKKAVKKLVESIPTDRDELFSYPVDWDQLDDALMEKRIKPWINKKIIEYIGEEEASLNDFICSKIQQKTKPEKLLEEVRVILDDEAELFIKKMWRLIVYETESKRCGLSK